MNSFRNKISYWLVPLEKDFVYFQDIIDRLAKRYGSTSFPPHITVFLTGWIPLDKVVSHVSEAVKQISPFRLKVNQLQHSNEITRTLYVSLFPNEEILNIYHSFCSRSRQPVHYDLDPHLSLIYSRMTLSDKEALAASLQIEKTWVLVDQLWVVSTPEIKEDRVDVDEWRVIYTYQLA